MAGPLTRRRIVVGLSAMTMLLAACGSSTPSNNPQTGGETQDPKAVTGGTLTLGVWDPQDTFLNAGIVARNTFSYLIDAPSAEGLLWYRSEDQTESAKSLAGYWQPWLATEVPTTDNGDVRTNGCTNPQARMCVTWKLRSGVKWHDGSDFTSHDVCDTFSFFWLKYGANNPTGLYSTSGWDRTIKCTEKDSHTAVVDYKSQYGPYLSLGSGVMGILPASMLDKAFAQNADITQFKFNADLTKGSNASSAYKTPPQGETLYNFIDGTGPYVMQSVDSSGVTYVRNQNYWNKSHQPHIDKLVFKFVADQPSEVAAIKAGNIDAGFDMGLSNLKGLLDAQSGGKLQVQPIPDAGAEKIDLNLCDDQEFWVGGQSLCGAGYKHSPYLANKDIRRAILMAINRQGIINTAASGKTGIPKDSFLYLGAAYIDSPDLAKAGYDAQAASAVLDKAGFKYAPQCDGGKYRAFPDNTCITLTLGTTSNDPGRVATEPLIEADLAQIGIKVAEPFNNAKPDIFFGSFADAGTLSTHQFDMAMYTDTLAESAPADPDAFYTGYVGCYDSASGSSPTTIAACSGANAGNNNVPSSINGGTGQNYTGINNANLNQAMETAHNAADLKIRTQNYIKAEKILADQIPEIPLYRQVIVDAYTPNLQGVRRNEIIWDYNTYDWFCSGGKCQSD